MAARAASEAARAPVRAPVAIISGGETTVTIRGKGAAALQRILLSSR
jgi:glycerate-2-kinase